MAAPAQRRRAATAGRAAGAAALVALALASVFVSGTAAASDAEGMSLTTPVLQSLRRLQTAWQRWSQAFQASEREAADAALEEILSNTQHLGMPRLPDLSVAAALDAVKAAEDGAFDKAQWALEVAEELDAGRPETELARARVHRAEGRYWGAVTATLRGYVRILRLPVAGSIVRHSALLWLIFTVALAGTGFVALQMVTKGPELVEDLRRFLPPGAPGPMAAAALALALLWPLFLPSGILWLLICWSILLWSYASTSERVVLGFLWAFVAGIPLGLAAHQRQVQLTLSPPTRALANVAAGRLSGTLFSDLGVLHTVVPENPAVKELIADLHRRFGQWEYARSAYTDLQELPGQSPRRVATALVNLGVYHHRKGDYATAINFFTAATEADRTLAAASFDLSQAYSQSYRFTEAHQALGDAREVDGDQVSIWLDRASLDPSETAVAVDGGLERIPEIHDALVASFRGSDRPTSAVDSWRRYVSLLVAAAAAALAVAFGFLRRQLHRDAAPAASQPAIPLGRWTRACVPGLSSAVAGHGGRGFLALCLFAGVLLIALMGRIGYRVPIAYQPWGAVSIGLCGVILVALVAVRWLLAKDE